MTKALETLKRLDDDELRDIYDSHSLLEGVATTVSCVTVFFASIFLVPFTIQGRIDWLSSGTWVWAGPLLTLIIVAVVVAVYNGHKMRKIGAVQSARARIFTSAVRRNRPYNPFEEVPVIK